MASKRPEYQSYECWQYLDGIRNGTIVAGERIRQLADMMLPRIESGTYKKWHYDHDRANHPVKFIETFCCYPSGEKMRQLMELELFQKACIQIMFGFVDDDGYRQFREVLWEIGRKNGKTAIGAAIELYMLMADGEGAPHIYNAATSRPQASLAYGNVCKMVKMSAKLKKRLRKGTVVERDEDGINFDDNMGYIVPLSGQTTHLDGLDVHFALFDELAACTNRDVYDLIYDGMAARKQPMMLCITTNGFVRNNIFDDRYEYGCRILDGDVDDDIFLPIIYEIDDRNEWMDESCWMKANPGLGPIKQYQFLKDKIKEAKENPNKVPTVLTKDFNIPENSSTAWLSHEEAVNVEMADLKEMGFKYGVAGFDASDAVDLTAACMLLMRPGDDRIYKLSMYWVPRDSVTDDIHRKERDDVPYTMWEKRGLVRLVEGNKVPKHVFIDWLEEVKSEYDIWAYACGYDRWHMVGTDEEQLQQYFGKDNAEVIVQGPMTLSDPMKQFRADLKAKRIVNNHNPIDEWCRMNVAVKTDINGNIQPDKKDLRAKNRIDGFLAEIDAYIALLRHWDDYQAII